MRKTFLLLAFFVFAFGIQAVAGPKKSPRNCNALFDAEVISRSEAVTTLKGLYPDLTAAQIEKKIKGAKNKFMFFRSFAPLFYRRLAANPQTLKPLKAAMDYPAVIAGDAHPENFGFLVMEDDEVKFTFNDVDDTVTAPAALDLVRFLASIRVFRSNFALKPILRAYRDGLEKDFESTGVLDDLEEKAVDGGSEPAKKFLDEDGKLNRSMPEVVKTDEALASVIRSRLPSLLPGAEVKEWLSVEKTDGGSAFRRRMLVRIKWGGEKVILEFKPVHDSSVAQFTGRSRVSPKVRIEEGLDAQQGGNRSDLYRAVVLNGKTYFMRPRFKGNKGVELSDFDADELADLFAEEAAALGRMHRRTLDDRNGYIEELKDIEVAVWERIASELAADSNQWYKTLSGLR